MPLSSWKVSFPAAILCLLGAAATVVLMAQSAGLTDIGCREAGGDCDSVLASRWSVFPPARAEAQAEESASAPLLGVRVPVTVLGFAYFVTLAAWLLLIGPPAEERRWWHFVPVSIAALGCLGSIGFIMVMASIGHWCPVCLTTHIINFAVLASVVVLWPRPDAEDDQEEAPESLHPSGRLVFSVVVVAALAFVLGWTLSERFSLSAEVQQLAGRLDRLTSDADVFAWIQDQQPEVALDIRHDDTVIAATDANHAELVVFTDLQCSYCRLFHEQLERDILPQFDGQLQVVFKHFPLCPDCNPGSSNLHAYACDAAYLAEAARLQGGSEAFLDVMTRIEHAPPRTEPWTEEEIVTLAHEAKLDPEKLLADRQSPEVRRRVSEDVRLARRLGITGSPALFLDGRRIDSLTWDFPSFWKLAALRTREQHEGLAGTITVARPATRPLPPANGAEPGPDTHRHAAPGSEPAASATRSASSGANERVRAAAQSLITKYDLDESGVLEQSEWAAMGGEPHRYDTDGNHILTVDEIVAATVAVKSSTDSATGPAAASPQKVRLTSIDIGDEIEIAGPTADGGVVDIRDWRGKVVLVDFWASWCGHCVEETPYLQRVYDRYHDQGLEIVGVSTDKTLADLQTFVAENGLPWPQIYFDEDGKRGRDNPVSRQHNVRGFPCMVVVGRDGKVTARLPRGHRIEEAIAEALGLDPAPRDVADAELASYRNDLQRPRNVTPPPSPQIVEGQVLEITGTTTDGEPFDVADWRGKPTLVVYWASWCGFCQKEMPNILDVYRRYHDHGFEVVGIGCDKSLAALTGYVEEKELPWPQLYDDREGLRGFDHPLCWRNGIRGIPAMFLLDGEGRVVHTKPRGPLLETEVAKLLNVAPSSPTSESPAVATASPSAAQIVTGKLTDMQMARIVIEKYDVNRDGVLQETEWSKMRGTPQRYDRNGDSEVTAEEFAFFVAKLRATRTDSPMPESQEPAPSDTAEEAKPAAPTVSDKPSDLATQVIRRFDTNGDDVLDESEWKVMPGQPQRMDRDGDGRITIPELTRIIASGPANRRSNKPDAPATAGETPKE